MSAMSRKGKLLFYFNDDIFCIKAFSHISTVSEYLLKLVLEDVAMGRDVEYSSSVGVPRGFSEKTTNMIGWMLSFCELVGQRDPITDYCVI